jgi:phosphoglycolate phosphatase
MISLKQSSGYHNTRDLRVIFRFEIDALLFHDVITPTIIKKVAPIKKSMQEIQLVIFDFDDTILHLNVDWSSVKTGVLKIAAEEGISFDPSDHLISISNQISGKPGPKAKVDEVFLRYETECVDNNSYELFPGMAQLLKELHSKSIKLAIASGNHTETINKILTQLDLLENFDVICGRDKVQQNKPAPDQLLFILERLKIPRERTLFTGDSINDEGAAQAAGIRYVQAEPEKTVELLRALLL